MPFDITFDRVLHIGINYVGSQCELNGCINDVVNLRGETKTKSRVIMTEVSRDRKMHPTRANIITQIQKFVTGVKAGEKLLFQYSGHGSYTRDTSGDEKDQRDETICPVDYARSGDITDDHLKKILVNPLPEGCQLWCVFDCCHSGTVVDLKYNYQVFNQPNSKRREWNKQIDTHYNDTKCKVICFSGCMDAQTSADAWEENKYQGAMTWGLIKAAKSISQRNKKGKKSKNGKRGVQITYKEVMKTLLKLMRAHRYSQIPQISSGHALNLDTPLWS